MKLNFNSIEELEKFYEKLHPELSVHVIDNNIIKEAVLIEEENTVYTVMKVSFNLNGKIYSEEKQVKSVEFKLNRQIIVSDFAKDFIIRTITVGFTADIMEQAMLRYRTNNKKI